MYKKDRENELHKDPPSGAMYNRYGPADQPCAGITLRVQAVQCLLYESGPHGVAARERTWGTPPWRREGVRSTLLQITWGFHASYIMKIIIFELHANHHGHLGGLINTLEHL